SAPARPQRSDGYGLCTAHAQKCLWKLPAPHTRARRYRSLFHLAFNLNLSEWHRRAVPGDCSLWMSSSGGGRPTSAVTLTRVWPLSFLGLLLGPNPSPCL